MQHGRRHPANPPPSRPQGGPPPASVPQVFIHFQLHPDLRKVHEEITPPLQMDAILRRAPPPDYSFEIEHLVLSEGDIGRAQRRFDEARLQLLGLEFSSRWGLQREEREARKWRLNEVLSERSELLRQAAATHSQIQLELSMAEVEERERLVKLQLQHQLQEACRREAMEQLLAQQEAEQQRAAAL
eukprot:EG_transcript_31251